MYISELLSDLTVHYNAFIRQAASQLGLTVSQIFHLISIPHAGVSMSRLSHKLGLDTSTLTRNIQKLEKMGLVIRSKGSYDKRVQNVVLTQRGDEVIEEIEDILQQTNISIMEYIDLDEQEHISDALAKLVWAMDCIRQK